jgi:hypothetical protein
MSDQENRNPQHSNLQKSDLEKKLGNHSGEPLQQKPPLPGDSPKLRRRRTEKKKAGLGCRGIFHFQISRLLSLVAKRVVAKYGPCGYALHVPGLLFSHTSLVSTSPLNFRQPSATATKRCEDGALNRQKDRETCARTTRPACAPNAY